MENVKKFKFNRVDNEKYNTVSINIEHAFLTLKENYKVLKNEKTKWNYRKTVIQLDQPDLRDLIKLWEIEVNDYLKSEGIEPLTILYGNKIYPKTLLFNVKKNGSSYIKLKAIWVNDKNKPFLQLE